MPLGLHLEHELEGSLLIEDERDYPFMRTVLRNLPPRPIVCVTRRGVEGWTDKCEGNMQKVTEV